MLLRRQSPSSTNTSIADRGCWERGNWVKMMTRHGGTFIYLSYHRSMDRHNYCQTLVLMENTQNIMTFNKLKFENFTRGEVSQLLTRRHGIKDHSPGPQTRHRHLKQNIPSFCKNCSSSVKNMYSLLLSNVSLNKNIKYTSMCSDFPCFSFRAMQFSLLLWQYKDHYSQNLKIPQITGFIASRVRLEKPLKV